MSDCTHGNMTAHGNPCPWCKNVELEKQLAELKRENELLRRYGNKDCTAMADEALKEQDNG